MPANLYGASISDHLLAAGAATDVAIIDGARRYTYAELRTAAARIAGELIAAGVRAGSRVGLLGGNSLFWVAGYLAAMKLGVVVPFSDKSTPEELAMQADWVDCAAILQDRRHQRRVGVAFADRTVITDAVLNTQGESAWPDSSIDPDCDSALMFTSGTTSRPKAVRVTHANILANTRSIVSYLELQRSDRMAVILPFHYCFGASLLHTHLAVGGSVALCRTFTFPQTLVDLIETESCTGFAGVPSSFQLLLKASDFATRPLPSLRVVQQAGGRLAPALIQELVAAQPGSRVVVMYGQTEATARLSYLPPELLREKLGSIGRGIPGVSLRVVDDSGEPVGPGEQGEIWAGGANISPGYLNDPEATAKKFPGGELRTGDLATVDSDGFVYITGRRGEFIKSWGYRISPAQIEEVALQHSAVTDAAAVGLPDDDAGEVVALAVVAARDSSVDPADLLSFLRANLAKHLVPRTIHILDAMPLTGSGKPSKPELRRLLADLSAKVT